jgi:hypothetical protein
MLGTESLNVSTIRVTPRKHRVTPCPIDYFAARGMTQAQKHAAPTVNAT